MHQAYLRLIRTYYYRVISFSGTQSSEAVTANTTNIAFTASIDRAGSWNGTQYIVPVTGDYLLSAGVIGSAAFTLRVYLDGSAYAGNGYLSTTGGAGLASSGAVLLTNLRAGQIISIRSTATCTVSVGNLGINRLSGPAVIAATETVAARYNIAAAVSISTTQPVNYATKVIDTHNAVTTGSAWKFTAPVSGIYRVSTALAMATSTATLTLRKNGTNEVFLGSATTSIYGGGSQILRLNAGEYIDVASDTASQNTNANTSQSISIERVGN